MSTQTQNQNALTITDGFSDVDPTASPLRGPGIRFKDRDYFSFADKLDVKGKAYAVTDRAQGWQKLERDCPPEYLMRQPGQPKPAQPFVDKKDWPLNFNGVPEHPWKWTHYLYLLDTATGEFSTFWSSTTGGNIAVKELSDQVALMRNVRPNAIPVVALDSKDMPTQYGSTKPRPFFRLLGWKTRDAEPQNLLTTEPKLVDVEKPSSEEIMQDAVPEKDWEAKGDPLPNLGAAAAPTKKKK